MCWKLRQPAGSIATRLGLTVLFWLASMGILIGADAAVRGLTTWPQAVGIGACASLGTWLLSLAFLRWTGGSAASIGIVPDRWTPLRFGIGLAGGFVLVAVHMALETASGDVRWARAPAPAAPAAVALAVTGYLLLAAREELAFRGYPLRRLADVAGAWPAQVVLAALFVIEHRLGGNDWRTALVGAGLGALVYGSAALASRGLALPMGLHAGWNIGDWARGGKGGGGLWVAQLDNGGAQTAPSSGLLTYALTMGMALLALECVRRAREAIRCESR